MANITRAEVDKINGNLKNGWQFDLRNFIFNQGDKAITRKIKLDEQHFITAKLYFSETYKNFRREGLEISLNISHWTDEGAVATSHGLGLFRRIPYGKNRRSFADLSKLSEVIDEQYIMDIYNSGNNSEKCLDGIILDKGGWKVYEV